MDNYQFTLRNDTSNLHNQKIGKYEAYFPDTDKFDNQIDREKIPRHVRINKYIFETRFNGGNNSIFIAPGNMKPIDKTKPIDITYLKASKIRFIFFKIKNEQLILWGLLIASLGVIIDTSFVIGKVHAFIVISESLMLILLGIAMLFKVVGFVIAFFNTINLKK